MSTAYNTVVWEIVKWPEMLTFDGGGHGVQFHDIKRPRRHAIVAFIEGFDWSRSKPVIVRGVHLEPNEITTEDLIEEMKAAILKGINDPNWHFVGPISRRIDGYANC
jgi:hypothetical protein